MLAVRLVAVVVVAVLGPVVLASYTCRITLFLPHTYPWRAIKAARGCGGGGRVEMPSRLGNGTQRRGFGRTGSIYMD